MKGRNVFGGLFLILLGTIFLLNNLGYVGWDVWYLFFDFWPLILVAIGLRLIFHNNVLIQIIAFLLIAIIPLAYYFGFGYRLFPRWIQAPGNYETYNWSLEKDEKITEGDFTLKVGAGRIELKPSAQLISLAASSYGRPDIDAELQGTRQEISIEQDDASFPVRNFRPHSEEWTIGLGQDVLWNLKFKAGAASSQLDLRGIDFSKLDLDSGAGKLEVLFGEMKNDAEVEIDAGAGFVSLVIPESVGVRARLRTGVGSKNLTGRSWQQDGDTYTTNNYDQAAAKLRIDVEAGAGTVNITTP